MTGERDRRREQVASELSQALTVAAELMTPRIQAASTLPQGRPATAVPSPRRVPGRLRGWLVPLASAVAVAVIAAGSVLIIRGHDYARPGSSAGVPGFYVTLAANSSGRTQVQVHRSSDGAVTATVPAPASGWFADGVTASAGDRTFFVAESKAGSQCGPTRFYRFTISGTGALTGFGQAGVQVNGPIGALAVSPDGTRMAYTGYAGGCPAASRPAPQVRVMDLATRAVTIWTSTVTGATPADMVLYSDSAWLSWTADSRSVSVSYQWNQAAAGAADQAVLLLDAGSGGGSLQQHSRVVWHQAVGCGLCAYQAQISPDGTTLIASMSRPAGRNPRQGESFDMSLWRISLPSGQPAGALFRTRAFTRGNGFPLIPLQGDGSGTYWIVTQGTSLGWVSNGRFHLMQPAGSISAAAW